MPGVYELLWSLYLHILTSIKFLFATADRIAVLDNICGEKPILFVSIYWRVSFFLLSIVVKRKVD